MISIKKLFLDFVGACLPPQRILMTNPTLKIYFSNGCRPVELRGKMNNLLKIGMRPTAAGIDRTERKLIRFLESHGTADCAIRKEIMVFRELVARGKSFYSDRSPETEVIVCVEVGDSQITIEISHPIAAKLDQRLAELDRTIQFIRSFQDPFEPYCMKQIEIAINPMPETEMGLGLAKIAYEANAVVDFYVSEDNVLNLSAIRSK